MTLKKWLFFMTLAAFGSNLAWSQNEYNWQHFHSSQDGIELYRADKLESGIIPFKATAIVEGALEDYLMLLLDSKGRVNWAPKLKAIEIHQKLNSNHFIYSEFYHTPWPATDRQFLLEGKVVMRSRDHVILEGRNSTKIEYINEDHIVCDVRLLRFEIMRLKNNKTKLSFSFVGDMKGWMPVWLINLIQRKWPLRFIQGIRKQVKEGKPVDYSIFSSLEWN